MQILRTGPNWPSAGGPSNWFQEGLQAACENHERKTHILEKAGNNSGPWDKDFAYVSLLRAQTKLPPNGAQNHTTIPKRCLCSPYSSLTMVLAELVKDLPTSLQGLREETAGAWDLALPHEWALTTHCFTWTQSFVQHLTLPGLHSGIWEIIPGTIWWPYERKTGNLSKVETGY